MSDFRSIWEIAQQVARWLRAVKWDRGDSGSELAFDRVEVFSALDFEKAIERLLLTEDRIALVIPTGSTWETSTPTNPTFGITPECRRTVKVTMIVSDRVVGDRIGAAEGTDDNPGCYALGELTRSGASGLLFTEAPQVVAVPVSDEMFAVQRDGEDVPGREACAIELSCVSDWAELAVTDGTESEDET